MHTQTCQVSNFENLPSIRLRIFSEEANKHKDLILPKEAYLEQSNGSYQLKLIMSETNFGLNQNTQYWVMGAVFLHYYYSIYDFQNMKVGLVEAI